MTFYLAYSDILSGIPSHVHPLHALHPLHPGLPGHIYIYISISLSIYYILDFVVKDLLDFVDKVLGQPGSCLCVCVFFWVFFFLTFFSLLCFFSFSTFFGDFFLFVFSSFWSCFSLFFVSFLFPLFFVFFFSSCFHFFLVFFFSFVLSFAIFDAEAGCSPWRLYIDGEAGWPLGTHLAGARCILSGRWNVR